MAQQKPTSGSKVARSTKVALLVWQKVPVKQILSPIKNDPDLVKTGYKYSTIQKRFTRAGIDTVEEFQRLSEMTDSEVSRILVLPNKDTAPKAVKAMIKKALINKDYE